jgi:hypothetical protein
VRKAVPELTAEDLEELARTHQRLAEWYAFSSALHGDLVQEMRGKENRR